MKQIFTIVFLTQMLNNRPIELLLGNYLRMFFKLNKKLRSKSVDYLL